MPMAAVRSDMEVASKPLRQNRRIACSSAASRSKARGRPRPRFDAPVPLSFGRFEFCIDHYINPLTTHCNQENRMSTELAGKRALVTGAARGIGAGIARALADKGADVAITYERSADRAAELVREIEKMGRRAVAIQADSADPTAVKNSVEHAVRALGGLDILV